MGIEITCCCLCRRGGIVERTRENERGKKHLRKMDKTAGPIKEWRKLQIITIILQLSLAIGNVPEDWKIANMILFKTKRKIVERESHHDQ